MLTLTICTGRRCAPSFSMRGCAGTAAHNCGAASRYDLVSDLGFADVVELDWWNSYRHLQLTVTHVPSRHWGARIIKDSHRGYGGYVLRDSKHSLYHAATLRIFPVSARSAAARA